MAASLRILRLTIDETAAKLLEACQKSRPSESGADDMIALVRELFKDLGGYIDMVEAKPKAISVYWYPATENVDPVERIVPMLTAGLLRESVLLMEFRRSDDKDNTLLLYNLAMAYSDLNILEHAVPMLYRLTELDPKNTNALVALGVALLHEGRTSEAAEFLRAAVAQEPENLWAHRNLGVCYLRTGQIDEASVCLRRAFELDPQDQQAVFGYAQSLHAQGQLKEADDLYRQTIALDEQSKVANAARKERTKLAERSFRSAVSAGVRPDATAYCLDALRKFGAMTPDRIRKIGVEIALLGQRGLDTNSPDQKYTLRNLPGQFSGLHLVCLMYVAFKQVGPDGPMGFDLTKEYEAARTMWEGEK